MRKKGLCMLLASAAWFIASTAEADWRRDFEVAQTEARASGKPMLIHFYADWCPPCRQMEATVLNGASIKNLLSGQVVGVKLNADFHKDLVRRFGVSSLPADVVLEPDGRVSASYTGATTIGTFEQRLRGLIRTATVAKPAPVAKSKAVAEAKPTAGTERVALKPVLGPMLPTPVAPVSRTVSMTLTAVAPAKADPASPVAEAKSISLVLQPLTTTSCLLTDGGASVGLSGYSPVALRNRKWVMGSSKHSVVFEDVTYWFATAQEAIEFRESPEQFTPGLNGLDPVALADGNEKIVGVLEFAATDGSKSFFFGSRANRDKFVANAERYAVVANPQ